MAKDTGILDILIKKQEISFFLLFFYYIFLLPITMEDTPCELTQFLWIHLYSIQNSSSENCLATQLLVIGTTMNMPINFF